ncbi:hypothetical protein BC827DRAFT_919764 [Russula dissimulans]|nr:hypothetical protein BC827DRAFT_919764 [Russula dissimulans]
MSVFETDYSNLFAAGLRVIQSRRTGRRSSPESALNPAAVSSRMSTSEHDHDPTPSTGSSSSWKTFHFPTRLWRRPSPRNNKASSADASSSLTPTNTRDAKPKPTRRRSRSMPGDVAEESTSALDVRIWDWTTRVSNAATIFGEEDEDECVDPYLDKVKPQGPDSLWEPEFTPCTHRRRGAAPRWWWWWFGLVHIAQRNSFACAEDNSYHRDEGARINGSFLFVKKTRMDGFFRLPSTSSL